MLLLLLMWCVTNNTNANCADVKCSDQNSSHRQQQEFATELWEYEFPRSFDSSLQIRRNGLTWYIHNNRTQQNLSAIKHKILSKNTTPHVRGINSGECKPYVQIGEKLTEALIHQQKIKNENFAFSHRDLAFCVKIHMSKKNLHLVCKGLKTVYEV